MDWPWETEYRPSNLCLRDRGDGSATVVWHPAQREPANNMVRIYDGYLFGKLIYSAASDFTVGRVIKA